VRMLAPSREFRATTESGQLDRIVILSEARNLSS
jgi:hypothetical protein